MRSRWLLRPISIGVVILVLGVSLIGCIALRRVVNEDRNRILTERGAAAKVVIDSLFQQEFSTLTVLGQVANTHRADATRDFEAAAATSMTVGVKAIGFASLHNQRFVVRGLVGDQIAHRDKAATGTLAALLSRASHSFSGVTGIMHNSRGTQVVFAIPVNELVIFAELPVTPKKPIPSATPPFDTLRGSLYASPTATPATLVLTTEKHLPLSGGPVQANQFTVGDSEWSLYYAAKGNLVGGLTTLMPWLVLAAGIFLAVVVAVMLETIGRRRSYSESLVEQRTKSLAEANSELEAARLFLRHLVATGPIVVTMIDPDDLGASYVSPNITRLFGISEADAMRPAFFVDLIDEPYLSALRQMIELVADEQSERYETLEYPIRLGDAKRWVSSVFVSSRGPDSDNRSVLIYTLDVDEQHRAAEASAAATATADAANRSKSEFLSRMSHELRTPLNAILGYAQLFEMSELDPDQIEPVHQILASGRHLLSLINEVLDISRIEDGALALSVEPVVVSDVLQTTMDMLRPAADRGELDLTLQLGCERAVVIADLQRLRQILLNLVTNAVKYTQRGGRVTVGCETRSDNMVRIYVSDNGPGISKDHHDLVFAPFERLSAAESEIEGTGMGLAVSRRLAEAMGATIGLASVVGEGSTFWIDLPAGQAIESGPASILPADDDIAIPSQDGPRRTVLLVEDNPANIRLVERIFRPIEDVRVVSTSYGRDAVEMASREHAAVVLLDLNLPDMSGERVLAALRLDPMTTRLPVIVISADATEGQINRLLAAGATRYLTKPFDVQELLDVVTAVAVAR